MSETCAIVAEVVVTGAKAVHPVAAAYGGAALCFYAPQACPVVAPTLATVGAAVGMYGELLRSSDAFESLNKLAFESGCRLLIEPDREWNRIRRIIVYRTSQAEESARVVRERLQREYRKSERSFEALNSAEGVRWLMRTLGGG